MADILIIDDRADNLEMLRDTLEGNGYAVSTAEDADTALAEIEKREPNLVLLDLWLRDSSMDGMKLLQQLRNDHPLSPVIMISAHGNIETAVRAIEEGAFTFIEKPVKTSRLMESVRRALEMGRAMRENAAYRARDQRAVRLLGQSKKMTQLRKNLESTAKRNTRVLFLGPPGAGKEEAARYLHLHSAVAKGPFVQLGAEEFPKHFESAWNQAEGGVLLIDEIMDLDEPSQAQLLRVLAKQTTTRSLGGNPGARLLSTTSRTPETCIETGQFREDLYHRFAVFEMRLPPLSERCSDIPELAVHFMRLFASDLGRKPRKFENDAMGVLQSHVWTGNVRELRNAVERLLITDDGDCNLPITAIELLQIGLGKLGRIPETSSVEEICYEAAATCSITPTTREGIKATGLQLREAREIFEQQYLLYFAKLVNGNIGQIAERAGLERTALYRRLHTLGIFEDIQTLSEASLKGNASFENTPVTKP